MRTGVDDEIVVLAVAVRAGDGEAEAGGLVNESQLGELTAAFGIAAGTEELLPYFKGFES